MKKLNLYLVVFVMGVICLSLSSCKKAVDLATDNCAGKLEAFSEAQVKYTQDMSVENCEAYVAAAEDYINACGYLLSASDKQEFQNSIDQAKEDCSGN